MDNFKVKVKFEGGSFINYEVKAQDAKTLLDQVSSRLIKDDKNKLKVKNIIIEEL